MSNSLFLSSNFVSKIPWVGFRIFTYFPKEFPAQVPKILPLFQCSVKFLRAVMPLLSNLQGIPVTPSYLGENIDRYNIHMQAITKTRLYNFDPLKPHFYIVKLGFTGVYIVFPILLKYIDCEYSLEPPRRGGSNEYQQSMF